METIWKAPLGLNVGVIGGHTIAITTPFAPWHSTDNPSEYPADGLAKEIQDALDAADPGVWFVYRSGLIASIVRLDYNVFSWVLDPAWAWYFGVPAISSGPAISGAAGIELAHGVRVSPPRRAWTRLKASDPGGGLVATVLDTLTYFDLRVWLTPTEFSAFAALANRPFVIGNGAAPWTELDLTGYLPLRVTDARALAQPRLLGSSAAIVEYQLETVLVR